MPRITGKNIAALAGIFLLVWLGLRYLFPLCTPFLLGGLLALAAEPAVRFLERRLPRLAAAGIGVGATLVLLTCLLILLAALLMREVSLLATALPDLEKTAVSGLATLKDLLTGLADRTPDGIRPLLNNAVSSLFSNSTALVDRLVRKLPSVATSVLGHVPGGFLTLGTGILSAFMISARFSQIRSWLLARFRSPRLQKYLGIFGNVRHAMAGWLKAQLKLSALSFLIVLAGLLLLRVSYAPVWAFFIALVDAIPVLGTGTVLLPWSLICLLQEDPIRAVGLLGIYITAMLSRTILEPRLVGKQLGLDPLVTLIALYIGYQLWGIGGMLLSPLLCVAATELVKASA